ncbi:MAG: hypothetical protein IKJ91_01750 [Clostridia bacterium]|nr:hypothetical protein [Clostridia bacterium]
MNEIFINGIDISEFKLYNRSLLKDLSSLSDIIKKKCGFMPETKYDEMSDGEHYIIVDGSELIADKYSIRFEGGNVIIKGSSHSVLAAIDMFCEKIMSAAELTDRDNLEGSTGKKKLYSKKQLEKVIKKVYDDPSRIIVGEQVCGNPKGPYNIEESIERFRNATKKNPGIMGLDLACYGLGLPIYDDVTWSAYICDIVDYIADGGIISASAHWANPSGYDDGYYNSCRGHLGKIDTMEGYEKAYTDLLTEGTELNRIFMSEIEQEARFLKALKDNGVSIIWRPLHEANGNWFWFCTTQNGKTVEAKYTVAIWKHIYKYFTKEWELDNLIWCYSPNVSGNINDEPGGVMSTTYLYPGDEYCDIVGVDWYTGGKLEITGNDTYLRLINLAKKPGAICEFGTRGAAMAEDPADQCNIYSAMNLHNDLLALRDKGLSFIYILTWYNRWNIANLSRGDELMATEMAMGLTEVKALFDSLK